jgi:hypothetical protein
LPNATTIRSALALAALGAASLAVPALAHADAPCGGSFMPIAEGAQRTYQYYKPESAPPPKPGQVILEQPKLLTIKVASMEKQDDATVVHLQEAYGDVTQETTITCSKDGVAVSPHSFFFAGEPGGGLGIELSDIQRDGTSIPDKLRPGVSWSEQLSAKVTRTPSEGTEAELGAGKIQVERRLQVTSRERAKSSSKSYPAYRVDFELSGRGMVEPELETGVEIPAGARGTMWFASRAGLVRAENAHGEGWKLLEAAPVQK